MKHYRYFLLAALCSAGLVACQPQTYELGAVDVTKDDLVEGVAFTVTPDSNDPNTICLKSLMDSRYTVLWEHPQGRSQESEVEIKIPFKGTYQVSFGVMTRGGVVYSDPYTFTLTTDNLSYVNDEFWTLISGGVGKSKTWKIDLDADGVSSRMFKGPIWFWTAGYNWDNLHTLSGGSYLDSYYDENASWKADEAIVPNSDWYWSADWAGNSWMCDAADFGTMTFDLIDGAHATVLQEAYGLSDWHGSYMLDPTAHTIDMTDAFPLHDSNRHSLLEATTRHYKILYLDENFLQILVEFASGDTPVTYNYVWEGYEEPVVEEEESFSLAEDWKDYFEPKTNHQPKYKLSDDGTFDWFSLSAVKKEIAGFTPVDDLTDVTLEFNTNDCTYTFTDLAGTSFTGTYTLSDDGVYTFSEGLGSFALSTDGVANFHANADKTLRILAYEVDTYTGAMTNMWLGSEVRDAQGKLVEYLGYHFATVIAGAGDTPRYAACMYFNNSGWSWTHVDDPAVDGGDANARSSVVYITGDGDYTFSFDSSYAESDMYLAYIDIFKILKKYPNADAKITSIKVDGSDITIDDSLIDRGVGDTSVTLRRYVLNPWNPENYFVLEGSPKLNFTTSLSVTIHVTMDTGSPFISEE